MEKPGRTNKRLKEKKKIKGLMFPKGLLQKGVRELEAGEAGESQAESGLWRGRAFV